jgi:nucleoside-triphosphatase THEP1
MGSGVSSRALNLGEVVGRDRELAVITDVLADVGVTAAAIVVQGDPGIGKTTLWWAGVEAARSAGFTVSLSRPREAEMPLAFCAVVDLVSRFSGALDALGAADRAVLDAVLGGAEDAQLRSDAARVGRAMLALVRTATVDRPLLIAIDDAQWLDAPSEQLLRFIARRVVEEPVVFLVTQRDRGPAVLGVTEALPTSRCSVLRLEGLSLSAIGQIIRRGIGEPVSRSGLVDLHRSCGGNPMFALEFARARCSGAVTEFPRSLRELVDQRLAVVQGKISAVLQALAVLGPTDLESLERLLGAQDLWIQVAEARAAGVISGEPSRVQFAHPLFASAVDRVMSAKRRRELHARAAEMTDEVGARARHLALATRDPNERVANELDWAAAVVYARGAPSTAAELADRASHLTPPDMRAAQYARSLAAAEYLAAAGAAHDAASAFDRLIISNAQVEVRVKAAISWALLESRDFDRAAGRLQAAIAMSSDDPEL